MFMAQSDICKDLKVIGVYYMWLLGLIIQITGQYSSFTINHLANFAASHRFFLNKY